MRWKEYIPLLYFAVKQKYGVMNWKLPAERMQFWCKEKTPIMFLKFGGVNENPRNGGWIEQRTSDLRVLVMASVHACRVTIEINRQLYLDLPLHSKKKYFKYKLVNT